MTNRDDFEVLLDDLKEMSIPQSSLEWMESLSEYVWQKHFKGNKSIKYLSEELDIDRRRWYDSSISVVEIYGYLLGVKHVFNMYSEGSEVTDLDFEMQFFEMEEIKTVSYKVKATTSN